MILKIHLSTYLISDMDYSLSEMMAHEALSKSLPSHRRPIISRCKINRHGKKTVCIHFVHAAQ